MSKSGLCEIQAFGDGNCAYNAYGILLAYHYMAKNLDGILSQNEQSRNELAILILHVLNPTMPFDKLSIKNSYTTVEVSQLLNDWIQNKNNINSKGAIKWINLQKQFAKGARAYIGSILKQDHYSSYRQRVIELLTNNFISVLSYSQIDEPIVLGDYFENMTFIENKIRELCRDMPSAQSDPQSSSDEIDKDYERRLNAWLKSKRPKISEWFQEEGFTQYISDERRSEGILRHGRYSGPLEYQLLAELIGIPISVKWDASNAMVFQGLAKQVRERDLPEGSLLFSMAKRTEHWNVYLPDNKLTEQLLSDTPLTQIQSKGSPIITSKTKQTISTKRKQMPELSDQAGQPKKNQEKIVRNTNEKENCNNELTGEARIVNNGKQARQQTKERNKIAIRAAVATANEKFYNTHLHATLGFAFLSAIISFVAYTFYCASLSLLPLLIGGSLGFIVAHKFLFKPNASVEIDGAISLEEVKLGREHNWDQSQRAAYQAGYESELSYSKYYGSYIQRSAYNEPFFTLGAQEAADKLGNRCKKTPRYSAT